MTDLHAAYQAAAILHSLGEPPSKIVDGFLERLGIDPADLTKMRAPCEHGEYKPHRWWGPRNVKPLPNEICNIWPGEMTGVECSRCSHRFDQHGISRTTCGDRLMWWCARYEVAETDGLHGCVGDGHEGCGWAARPTVTWQEAE
jgi:hypothetical protein